MSFGGSVLGMIISLKNNSRSKIRVSKMLKENQRQIRGLKKDLHFKKVNDAELKIIKQEIKRKAKQQRRIKILISIPFLFVLIAISIMFWTDLKKEIQQDKIIQLEKDKKEQRILYDKYLWELNEGYKWLAKEKYKAAKHYFLNARKLRPYDYTTQVAITTAYMYDCIKNKVQCDTVNTLLMNLDASYTDKKEVNDLMEYFMENEELFSKMTD